MSPRGWQWWTVLVLGYIALLIWMIISMDPATICSNNQPC